MRACSAAGHGAYARAVSPASRRAGYAISSWTFENGVVAEYVYDYGAFAIRARLDRLATRARPSC
jgi:hypothetical protein